MRSAVTTSRPRAHLAPLSGPALTANHHQSCGLLLCVAAASVVVDLSRRTPQTNPPGETTPTDQENTKSGCARQNSTAAGQGRGPRTRAVTSLSLKRQHMKKLEEGRDAYRPATLLASKQASLMSSDGGRRRGEGVEACHEQHRRRLPCHPKRDDTGPAAVACKKDPMTHGSTGVCS